MNYQIINKKNEREKNGKQADIDYIVSKLQKASEKRVRLILVFVREYLSEV